MAAIQKWGNSLGVRLPKAFVDQLGLREGSEIELRLTDESIVIAAARKPVLLQDLLAGCNRDLRPEPIDWGANVGREML